MNSAASTPPNDAPPRGAVCYVVDENYLFPTLVSAAQARRFTSPDLADVIIVCVGARTARVDLVASAAASLGVLLISADQAAIENMHVMFGRLFLHRILPDSYGRILYIDGDTQVAGTLDPLFRAEVPEGGFLACRDPSSLFAELSPAWRARIDRHREAVGLTGDPQRYFNSGVLVFDREGWSEIAQACIDAYRRDAAVFVHPDQDALNVAVGDRCELISSRWNFPGFLIGSPAETARQPAIYHFMSNPRPWIVASAPWGRKWARPYEEMRRAHPELSSLAPSPPLAARLRYTVQQAVKLRLSYGAVGRMVSEPMSYPLPQ